MKCRLAVRGFVLVLCLAGGVRPAGAEEITLRDGQKITGTIVGIEDGMFRVETEFGFALVRKDKVSVVNFGPAVSKTAQPKPAEVKKSAEGNKAASGVPQKTPGVPPPDRAPGATTDAVRDTQAKAVAPPAAAPKPPPEPLPPPPSRPLDEALPARIQEHLEGFNYVNDTFQFSVYKPPSWQVYDRHPGEKPQAIVVMGTPDERTILIVGRQVWSGKPDLATSAIEANVERTYQEYQKLSESLAPLDGRPAVRRAFRGLIDGVEWHGISAHVAQGNTVYGIIGLTSAEMNQFEQALLNKVINSFHFLPLAKGSAGPQAAAQAERASMP